MRGQDIIGHVRKFPRHWLQIPFRFGNRVSPTFSTGRDILIGRIESDIHQGFRAFFRFQSIYPRENVKGILLAHPSEVGHFDAIFLFRDRKRIWSIFMG